MGAHEVTQPVCQWRVEAIEDFSQVVVEYVYIAPYKLAEFRKRLAEVERRKQAGTAKRSAAHLAANRRDMHECPRTDAIRRHPWSESRSSRLGGNARLVSQRSRTKSSSERWRCCLKRSTSRTFKIVRMAFGQVGAYIRPYTHDASDACGRASAGSRMQMSWEICSMHHDGRSRLRLLGEHSLWYTLQ
jgi:hypothetical protein